MNVFPFRLRFAKMGRTRFLSHHDLMRLFERALRRSDLPIRMTEGYHPHPILSFPTALGLGIESEDEIFEMELSTWIAPREIQKKLGEQLPATISILSVEAFQRKKRTAIDFVEYEARVPGLAEPIQERIRQLLSRKECVVQRRREREAKAVDIRPYVMAVDVESDRILLRIKITDQGTAKPEEVLHSLGIEVGPDVRIKKTYTELRRRDP